MPRGKWGSGWLSGILLRLFLPLQALLLTATSVSAAPLPVQEKPSVDCEQAITTLDINHCAKLELDVAERRLNQAYQTLVKQLTQPDTEYENYTEMRQSLQAAQQAWIKFREADCDTQYLLYGSGTIRTVVYLGCMRERAEQRTKELDNYIPY